MEFWCELLSPLFNILETVKHHLDWLDPKTFRKILRACTYVTTSSAVTYYVVIYHIVDNYDDNRFDEGFEAGCNKMKQDMNSIINKTECKTGKGD